MAEFVKDPFDGVHIVSSGGRPAIELRDKGELLEAHSLCELCENEAEAEMIAFVVGAYASATVAGVDPEKLRVALTRAHHILAGVAEPLEGFQLVKLDAPSLYDLSYVSVNGETQQILVGRFGTGMELYEAGEIGDIQL